MLIALALSATETPTGNTRMTEGGRPRYEYRREQLAAIGITDLRRS